MGEVFKWIFCFPCMMFVDNSEEKAKKESKTMNSPLIPKGSKVVAIGDYDPSADIDEGEDITKYFTLQKGDEIEVLDKPPSGWWFGRLRGKEGYFPSNFVQESRDSVEFETLRVITSHADYKASTSEELSLKEGDEIKVYREFDDGWWYGEVDGKRGYFPYNYTSAYAYKANEEI